MGFFTRPTSTKEFSITFDRRVIVAWTGLFLLLTVMLIHSWYGPDIWYHLTWGRTLLAHGLFLPEQMTLLTQPIVTNVYWLYQIALQKTFAAIGVTGVTLAFLALWWWVAVAWLWLTEAWRRRTFGPLLFLVFVCCMQLRFEQRPEVVSYAILAAMLCVLTRLLGRPLLWRKLLLLAALQAVWSNTHGYFALGPLLGAALALASFWERIVASRRRRILRALVVVLLLVAASLLSPFTWHNWEFVASMVDVGRGLRTINQELMPPSFWPMYWPLPLFWALWAMTSLWSVRALYRRGNSWAALLALAGAYLALQAVRNLPLYFLLSAPALREVSIELERTLARAGRWLERVVYFFPSWIALCLAFSVINGDYYNATRGLATFGFHLESASYPIGATEYLRRTGFRGKIFCDSYDGGYLEYHLADVRVAGDSYFSDVPTTLKFFAAVKEPAALTALDREFGFDALLINIENLDVLFALWSDPHWNLAYADSHRLLFRRRDVDPNPLALEDMRFYFGEDLRSWVYAFGVSNWAGIALKFNDLPLAHKLAHDLAAARVVPSTFVRYLLELGTRAKDAELIRQALAFKSKMYWYNEGDRTRIKALTPAGAG